MTKTIPAGEIEIGDYLLHNTDGYVKEYEITNVTHGTASFITGNAVRVDLKNYHSLYFDVLDDVEIAQGYY